MKKTPLLKSYSLATRLLSPALPLWLRRRARAGKEDPERLGERKGISKFARPEGSVVWMHAASVGESQMLMPLIHRILDKCPNVHIVITTGTVTSAALLAERLPANALHQYAPADHPRAVKNFLSHWQPDLAIFAESELWPNMIMAAKGRDIPLALVNARMSAASIERWAKRGGKSVKALLACFDVILAADESTARGLSWLSGREIISVGNLKDAAPPLEVDQKQLKKLKTALGRRPVWCAASTHKGEEELIAHAALEIKAKKPKALLILAPRHPERSKEVQDICTKAGLNTLRWSSGQMPGDSTDVFLMDCIGKMGLVYRLGKVSFVGGSLLKTMAGHNPLEAARLGSAVITGNAISSFADTYMALLAYGGATRTPKKLAPQVLNFLQDPDLRKKQTKAALQFASSRDAILDYVWDNLEPLLPQDEEA